MGPVLPQHPAGGDPPGFPADGTQGTDTDTPQDTAAPDTDTDVGDTDTDAEDTDTDTDTAAPSDTLGFVDANGDGVPALSDCDDDDPDVYPGAPDACGDGLDHDCVPGASGTIVFAPDAPGASLVDHTALATTGTPTAPAARVLSEPGTLYLCDGTWHVNVDPLVDGITVQGEGQTSTVVEVDDAGSTGALLTTVDGPSPSTVQDLTLREASPTSSTFARLLETAGTTAVQRVTLAPSGSRCIGQQRGRKRDAAPRGGGGLAAPGRDVCGSGSPYDSPARPTPSWRPDSSSAAAPTPPFGSTNPA